MSKSDGISSGSFADKMAKLEEIVEWFDSDIEDIDESIKRFEQGSKIADELKVYLERAKNKVEKVKKDFSE